MDAQSGPGSPFVIVSSPGMHDMARAVCKHLEALGVHFPHLELTYTRFANGEVLPMIPQTIRRQHVFFFHPLLDPSPNDAAMMMFLANDAMKRASVAGITLVLPYMSYLRQDRKDKPRVPISARMLADLIESNKKVERVITIDMHAEQEQGFFSIPVDNLNSIPLFADYFIKLFGEEMNGVAVVSPDFGGAVRARRFAKKLGDVPVTIFEKRRPSANKSEVVSLVGAPIAGATVLIYDDMIDTGGTIREVAAALRTHDVKQTFVCATHGIFSGDAREKFAEAGFPVICTDSIPREAADMRDNAWLTTVSLAQLLSKAVYEASLVGGSISKLL